MRRNCSHCESHEFRRLNRMGFFEKNVLARFGYFPWECVLCRRKVYLRGDGHSRSNGVDRTRPNE
jgi:hypothetical protein